MTMLLSSSSLFSRGCYLPFLVYKAKKKCTGLCNLWILFFFFRFPPCNINLSKVLSFPFFFTERVRIFEVIVNVNYVHSGVPLVNEARQIVFGCK